MSSPKQRSRTITSDEPVEVPDESSGPVEESTVTSMTDRVEAEDTMAELETRSSPVVGTDPTPATPEADADDPQDLPGPAEVEAARDRTVEAIEGGFSRLEDTVKSVRSYVVERISTECGPLASKVEGLESKVDDLEVMVDAALGKYDRSANEIRNAIIDVRQWAEKSARGLAELEKTVRENEVQLRKQLEGRNNRVVELDGRLSETRAELDEVRAERDKLRTTYEDLNTKYTQLQQRVMVKTLSETHGAPGGVQQDQLVQRFEQAKSAIEGVTQEFVKNLVNQGHVEKGDPAARRHAVTSFKSAVTAIVLYPGNAGVDVREIIMESVKVFGSSYHQVKHCLDYSATVKAVSQYVAVLREMEAATPRASPFTAEPGQPLDPSRHEPVRGYPYEGAIVVDRTVFPGYEIPALNRVVIKADVTTKAEEGAPRDDEPEASPGITASDSSTTRGSAPGSMDRPGSVFVSTDHPYRKKP